MAAIRTTCPYCGVGCGIVAETDGDGAVRVRGDEAHPANRGGLCGKGSALAETLTAEGRLLFPEIAGQRVRWDEALGAVASGLRDTIAAHGPEAVAFYVSGQMLTEDYYVANKLMKGFIGSGNIDTNSRLCMASSVAGHRRGFGADTVPGCYDDFDRADLIVLVGSNTAWCHPILYQRIVQAQQMRGARLVVIDPRRTATCEGADLHLPLRPGTDVFLFNGLLRHLADAGAVDRAFIGAHLNGFEETVAAARADAPEIRSVAAACDVSAAHVERFFHWFAKTENVVTVYSQGVNQSSSGTDKVNAILNCHLATGRIGRPGMGPFSLTGQPNAMGGREVGGLANQLAAHMAFEPEVIDRVGRFWNAPNVARREGLKAVDMFRAVADGEVKALWIMATNPAVSLPESETVRAGLRECPLVIVSDCVRETDTNAYADILLPAASWGEKDGTVTNSERRISRQRAFLPPAGHARPDWWIVAQVARRMGYASAFAYESPAAIFREHAALSAFENERTRGFDIGALAGLGEAEYDALAPVQWPVQMGNPGGTARMFSDARFFTKDRRAKMVPVRASAPVHTPDEDYPLVLNTGRVRDQWHTMTRTGNAPRLWRHAPEPFLEMHPDDAAASGLQDSDVADLVSRWGRMRGRVRLDTGQRRGMVFAPMHWSDRFSGLGAVGRIANAAPDPLSGQPELKHTPIRVEPVPVRWSGFVLTREAITLGDVAYWARSQAAGCSVYELAGTGEPDCWDEWASALVGGSGPASVQYQDARRGTRRWAWLDRDRLSACLFVSRDSAALPRREAVTALFEPGAGEASMSWQLLGGGPATSAREAILCSCFEVGLAQIISVIRDRRLTSVEAIGSALRAGTNCGSCIPEMKRLLAEAAS